MVNISTRTGIRFSWFLILLFWATSQSAVSRIDDDIFVVPKHNSYDCYYEEFVNMILHNFVLLYIA